MMVTMIMSLDVWVLAVAQPCHALQIEAGDCLRTFLGNVVVGELLSQLAQVCSSTAVGARHPAMISAGVTLASLIPAIQDWESNSRFNYPDKPERTDGLVLGSRDF